MRPTPPSTTGRSIAMEIRLRAFGSWIARTSTRRRPTCGRRVANEPRRRTRSVNASDVRVPHARLIVVVAALLASAAILWLARNMTFYYDEWTFILGASDWTAATLLKPHNEHPVMLTRAIYAVLLSTVGLRSYLPYMAALLAVQAATVVLLFEL